MLSREHLLNDLMTALEAPGKGRPEDQHWQDIESRLNSRGSEWINVGKATSLYAADRKPNENRSQRRDEELELGIALPSESESQYYSQNDTDLRNYRNVAPISTELPVGQTHVQALQGGAVESHIHPAPQPRQLQSSMGTDNFGHSIHVPSSVLDSLEEFSDSKEVRELHACEVL